MKYALEKNISRMDIDYQKGHLEEIIDTITSKYGVDSSEFVMVRLGVRKLDPIM